MAENNIKELVAKQTSAVTIGTPKQREVISSPIAIPVQEKSVTPKGRPKCEFERIKLSMYIPVEFKEQLVKIQHLNFRPSMNDVLMEAVDDIIKKYSM